MPYRWVILALLWALYAIFGLVARSVAPLVTPILDDLGISYSQMGFILGSWQLTYIAVSIVAGAVIDRWGLRKSLFVGTVVIALSAGLRYFSTGFESLLIFVAIFGIGGPLLSVGGPKAISLWFAGKDRSLAMGIYLTGSWTGGLVVLAATNSLIMPLTGYSWRLTFGGYGILTLAIALLWLLFSRDTGPTAVTESAGIGEVFGKLIRVRNVRVALASGLCSFAITHGFTNWLPKILETGGLSPSMAGYAASIPLFAGIIAVLAIPRAVPSHLRGRTIALLALLVIVALMVTATTSGAPMVVGLVLFGIASSSTFPLMMLILMETPEVGPKYMGSAGGMYFCFSEIGGFTGPLVIGAIADTTGAFWAGSVFLACLALAIFAVTFLLKATPANS